MVELVREIKPPIIRYPGGNFVSGYHWEDGIGDRDSRPIRYDRAWNVWEPNDVGIDEFMVLCDLLDCEPYISVNAGNGTAAEAAAWVEYCNGAPNTVYGARRAANGYSEPYGIKYWGIGNESWGCGGNFTPEEYAAEYRRFATWAVPDYGVNLAFIASGPSGLDLDWTRRFFEALNERRSFNRMWGWALHHYTNAPNGEAVAFDDTAWYDLLSSADRMDSLITAQGDGCSGRS